MVRFRRVRAIFYDLRHGWLSIPLFYLVLTTLAYGVYRYFIRFPEASGIWTVNHLWTSRGSVLTGLRRVDFIFAWGFVVQLILQLIWVVRRKPRQAGIGLLLKHGAWTSLNAGFFEELIFRLYAFLSFVILARLINVWSHGLVQKVATNIILPVANVLTLGFLRPQFSASNWAIGVAIIVGSLFFRDAHLHYHGFSKLNVWFIGLVMFWLVFNYGLLVAILAHFLYDLAVFTAIAVTSPLQPRLERRPN